jgi:hypothetical protein
MKSENTKSLNRKETRGARVPSVRPVNEKSHVYEETRPFVSVPVIKIREIQNLCCSKKKQKAFTVSEVVLALFSASAGRFLSAFNRSEMISSLKDNCVWLVSCVLLFIIFKLCKANEVRNDIELAEAVLNHLSDYSEDFLKTVETSFEKEIEIYNQSLLNGPLTDMERKRK